MYYNMTKCQQIMYNGINIYIVYIIWENDSIKNNLDEIVENKDK